MMGLIYNPPSTEDRAYGNMLCPAPLPEKRSFIDIINTLTSRFTGCNGMQRNCNPCVIECYAILFVKYSIVLENLLSISGVIGANSQKLCLIVLISSSFFSLFQLTV